MTRVRMLVDISGGRADGTEWPRYGETLECDDREAQGHVATGRAEWADDEPAPVPADEPESPAAATEPPATGDEPPEPENGSQDDTDATPDVDPHRPGVRAPKQDWVDYVTAHRGVHPARAAEMTKADLTREFGRQA